MTLRPEALIDFEGATVEVRLDRGVIEDRDRHLGVRGLRTQLQVGVLHGLADGVDTNQGTSAQEVLALGISFHGQLAKLSFWWRRYFFEYSQDQSLPMGIE